MGDLAAVSRCTTAKSPLRCQQRLDHIDEPLSFANLVRSYEKHFAKDDRDQEKWFGSDCTSLNEAIRRAVQSKVRNGAHHSHQCRIPSSTYPDAESHLLALESRYAKAQNFQDLFEITKLGLHHVSGSGELFTYDIADRISCYLNLRPNDVFLHRGVRHGASNLGLNVNRASIPVSEFKGKFGKLTATEIENVLCIYKDQMALLRSQF